MATLCAETNAVLKLDLGGTGKTLYLFYQKILEDIMIYYTNKQFRDLYSMQNN